MTDETYQGWCNRETWALHLWLTNEEALYHESRARAADGESALRDWVENDLWPELHQTHDGLVMLKDVGSLWRVDWRELAAALQPE
ncbi:hypothetical protein ACFY05_32690 [Microtetraspora fusca]|uniref:Uncharacterized protein n=1 Tax=Microtetraspora fusca TaxID=1997 RepID=A0ABW6VIL5_MICFU